MNKRHEPALKLFALLWLGALLSGCTTLTEDLPDASASGSIPVQSEATSNPEASHYTDAAGWEAVVLMADAGEKEVFRMTGDGSSSGGGSALEKGEAFVSWICEGTGPLRITLSDGSAHGANCGETTPGQVNRNSFVNDVPRELEVFVEADSGIKWQVLVTQKAR